MIKAIIFDCFGVLASDGLLPFRRQYFGDKPDLMEEAMVWSRRVDAGLAAYEDMLRWHAEKSGISYAEAKRYVENNVPDEALFQYIRKVLKPIYKIGLLSNAGNNWLHEIFAPEQIALFDNVALSYETRFVKPDAGAYQTIANRLSVEIHECVMIDDQERYCQGARKAGMQAILYTSFSDFQQQLDQLLHSNL
jgi:HAD superfamily hydrolase (TIGR01509 family)